MGEEADKPMLAGRSAGAGAVWGGLGAGARAAGYLGLLPFLLALGCVSLGARYGLAGLGMQIALVWGAVILTFIAAVHWGLALAGRWPWSAATVVGSTLPSVVAAVAVLVGDERGLAILVAGFGAFWLLEHRAYAERLPAQYLELRRMLTLCVCALLVFTAFAAEGNS
jgi:hypothetical protein